MSAYCQFKYSKQFFLRYNVGPGQHDDGVLDNQPEKVSSVTGQLVTKVSCAYMLLVILKRAVLSSLLVYLVNTETSYG
jgi:hypothetical protein